MKSRLTLLLEDLRKWADAYEDGGGMAPWEVRSSLHELADRHEPPPPALRVDGVVA